METVRGISGTRESEHVTAQRTELGRRLARRRERYGLSQKQLAQRVFYDRTSITKIEAGQQSAPQAFWCEADRMLDADGELVAAFHVLAATKETSQGANIDEAPGRLLSDVMAAAAVLPTTQGADHARPVSAPPEHVNTVVALQMLSIALTNHSCQVLLGEAVDWAEIARKLDQAANACRGHVVIKPYAAR